MFSLYYKAHQPESLSSDDVKEIARATSGFTFADLSDLLKEAALQESMR